MAVDLRKNRAVHAVTHVPPGERPGVFAVGRRCRTCGHTISRYNPNPTCWAHSPPARIREFELHLEREAKQDFFEILMSEAA